MARQRFAWFDSSLIGPALVDAFKKLEPRSQLRSPVMFVVYIGSMMTTALAIQSLIGIGEARPGFILAIAIWLWFTVLFANFAEALAEGRSKAQAASLRALKHSVAAKKINSLEQCKVHQSVPATQLRKGDLVFIEAGDIVPADAEVIDGVASVDESAITGEAESRFTERRYGGGS